MLANSYDKILMEEVVENKRKKLLEVELAEALGEKLSVEKVLFRSPT